MRRKNVSLLAFVFLAAGLLFIACPIQHDPADFKIDDAAWVPDDWTGVITGHGLGFGDGNVRISLGFADGELVWAVFDPGLCTVSLPRYRAYYTDTMHAFIATQSFVLPDVIATTTATATARGITQATVDIVNQIPELPPSDPPLDDPPGPPFINPANP